MVANILPADPPPPPTLEVAFSEHGHVAYQNLRTHKCSNMVANIYFTRSPPPPPPNHGGGGGQNSNFSEHGHVAYQIKGNAA